MFYVSDSSLNAAFFCKYTKFSVINQKALSIINGKGFLYSK
mgnify:CR=1 FL=1